ncbi:predicted protein [Naegleria gruberi]|uniref:Predicted protein n=1 Tax=Naegleria gruberi TaxID=5762 RepID=D2VDM8_NAEGR|nr:uncharacterized protein NAEGRDRAFT_66975 [Naegleria gruberi]EFC44924.1 predicted protein [Naegleria gruberi]|eukprot:XP_002677668.1 predicted protein [Naegleria gruberi strain NEG-M]
MGNNPSNDAHIGTLPKANRSSSSSSSHRKSSSTISNNNNANQPSALHLNLVMNGNVVGATYPPPNNSMNNSINSSPVGASVYQPNKTDKEALIDESLESQTEVPNEITVMNFSIRRDSVFDGMDQWRNRKDAVANIILESNADIICIQDALQHQILDLFTMLNEKQERSQYLWFGLGQSFNQNTNEYSGEYVTIFYNTDKIELLDQGCFWYSYTPSTKGSRGWDSVAPRLCTWCKFRNVKVKKGNSFHVFNTHWDIGVEARRNSAYLIREYIENLCCQREEDNTIHTRPCIVMGNLNALPDSNAIHLLETGIDLGAKSMEESGSDEDTASDASNYESDEEDLFTLVNSDPTHHPTFVGLDGNGPPSSSSSSPQSKSPSKKESVVGDSVTIEIEAGVFPKKVQGKCTDYIFVSPNVKVLDFKVITDIKCQTTQRNASDHLPIMAALLV